MKNQERRPYCIPDDQLLINYLAKKSRGEPMPSDDILVHVADPYGHNPSLISEIYGANGGGKYGDEWYFLYQRNIKKSGDSVKGNRVVQFCGYWQAGTTTEVEDRDGNKIVPSCKRQLYFHLGTKRNYTRTKWIMTELKCTHKKSSEVEGEWVACRIYRKDGESKSFNYLDEKEFELIYETPLDRGDRMYFKEGQYLVLDSNNKRINLDEKFPIPGDFSDFDDQDFGF